jgi:hypothetical protein
MERAAMVRAGVVLVVVGFLGGMVALGGARLWAFRVGEGRQAVAQAHGLDPRALTLGVEPLR